MKYYEIHCETPYCGEDNYYYFKTDDKEKLKEYAQECLYENGNEWYDDQAEEDYPDENDYFNECNYTIKEITREEYLDECPWEREED